MTNKTSMRSFILVLTIVLILSGCAKKEPIQADDSKEIEASFPVVHLSNPDEALNMLKREINPNSWSKYLTKYNSISDERNELCFVIGLNITNAILSVYLDDYDTAEDIIKSIKKDADNLNIKSNTIEALIIKLSDDLKIEDKTLRSEVVKQTINLLQDSVISTLNIMGNGEEVLFLEFGGWLEAVNITSKLVINNYSENVSSVLNRSNEVNYFIERFLKLDELNETPKYIDITNPLDNSSFAFITNENHAIEYGVIVDMTFAIDEIKESIIGEE